MNTWILALAAATGGGAGAALRFGINELFIRRGWGGLPFATLSVNVIGCFLAGLVLVWIDTKVSGQALWRNLLITGVLGGLTTFSALGVELWQLIRAGRWDLAALMTAATVVLGVLAVALGYRLGKQVFGL